jgi:hypothetical protein
MPAEYRSRRNEMRNNRHQDNRARRAVKDSRREERVARLDIARRVNARVAQHENNFTDDTAIRALSHSTANHFFLDPIFDSEEDFPFIDVFHLSRLSSFSPFDFEVVRHELQFGDYQESEPSLTDTDIDEQTESFNFPESKQGYCAIDQEEISHGDSCRRIKQVPTGAPRICAHNAKQPST